MGNDSRGRIFRILSAFHPELEIGRHYVPSVDKHVLAFVIHVGANPPVDFFDLLFDLLLRNVLNKGLRRTAIPFWNVVTAFDEAAERSNFDRLFQLEKHSFHLVVAGLYGRLLFQERHQDRR